MDRPWIRARACYNWLPTNWLAALISSRGVVGTRYYKKASFTCVKEQCIILPRSLSFMRHESATPTEIALARSGKSWYRVHHSGWKRGWMGGPRFLPFWISCSRETRERPFPFKLRYSSQPEVNHKLNIQYKNKFIKDLKQLEHWRLRDFSVDCLTIHRSQKIKSFLFSLVISKTVPTD